MITRKEDKCVDVKNMFGGAGEATLQHIRHGADELNGKGRVFAHVVLKPGCEIGWHIHHGDSETYYILKGTGEYSDNGTMVTVNPGDVTYCEAEEGHSLKNNGTEDLEAIALVLFK